MNKCYLGIDIGSIVVKGVVIDSDNNIIASKYLYIEKNSIDTVKRLISILKQKINKLEFELVSVGTTGVARKIVGTMLDTNIIKNEIISNTIGITSIIPNIRTIIDIGGQDIKIIELNKGNAIDYNIYNLYTLDCNNENDIVNKIINTLNNIYSDKKIIGPISLQGGFSKNIDIVRTLEGLSNESIYIDKKSLFIGALGVAILTKTKKFEALNEKEVV